MLTQMVMVVLSMQYAYGVDVVPGYKITPSLVGFARVGWSRGKFKHTDADATDGINFAETYNQHGIRYGLGFDYSIKQNWLVRAEYDHTTFN